MSHEHHHHHHHECCANEHEHHHHHHDGQKSQLMLIGLTVILLIGAILIEKYLQLPTWQLLLVYLVPYLLIGHDTLKEAVEGIIHGDAFNEHFLMSVATIGALCIGFLPGAETEFPEAVFVMLFFQVGELFEGYAEGKSRESISHLMNIRPDIAHLLSEERRTEDGEFATVLEDKTDTTAVANSKLSTLNSQLKDVTPDHVAVGSIIVIRPGEKVPLDGVVIEGTSALNTVALTGESIPREIGIDDEVISGCVNLSGVIKVRTTKSFGESTVSKIIELVEHATEHKSKSEAFITKFARVYTPIVVFAAIALAILPPLYFAIGSSQLSSFNSQFPTWLYRALMFLVVSCPCALVISVPLTFFGGIGGASRHGILIKGANYMDILAKVDTVVFDKTGTLTHGLFAVDAVHPDSCDEHQLLHLAAHVEHFSTHPIGAALRDAFPDEATDGCHLSDVEEIAGQGIKANVEGKVVCVGNTRMMETIGAKWHDCHHVGTIIHVAIDGTYAGHIVINDKIKEDSAEAISQLKELGVNRTVMLTGDRKEVAAHVAQQLQLDEYHAELLPADKVAFFENGERRTENGEVATALEDKADTTAVANSKLYTLHSKLNKTAFVGDGINDAPVLARADVGIAMGGLGSDAAIEAADVVLMDDHPSKIALAIRIARRTLAIAHQNVWFAIGVKVAVLILATFGLATMWLAVFADVGVTVLAVLNAMRALK
ncbi:MAG: heavy metal translocating P-type ATPase [Prevotella sp.]|nr:heavy metal translocating P-type ATPase [Prevotella sp.]